MTLRCYFVPFASPPAAVTDFDVGSYQWWSEEGGAWNCHAWMNTTDGAFRHGEGFKAPVPASYLDEGVQRGTMVRVW